MTHKITWSYSSMKAFETCPSQYYHTFVTKQYKREETDSTLYGTDFHKACELYVKDGVEVPERFEFIKPTLDYLKAKPGERHCELKLGLNRELAPCDFFAVDVWYRGVIDLLIIDGATATIVDYKTSKNAKYADTGQLELMALLVFRHFPDVKYVRGALLFVISNELVKEKYDSVEQHSIWSNWIARYTRLEQAFETGIWNPRPSGLCQKFCPVLECVHNGRS